MNYGNQPLLKLNDGNVIPQLGFGVFQLPNLEDAEKAILTALKTGFRHIDSAHRYDNEKAVGTAIKKSGIPRKDIFITTKLAPHETCKDLASKGIDAMLKRLDTEYIDLLLIHHPVNDYCSAWKEMEEAVKAGKVRSIGLSNFEFEHWDEIMKIATIKPAILQVEGHPYFNQHVLKERNKLTGTLLETWFPIGHGDQKMFDEPYIKTLGEKYKKTPAQVILRWHIQEGYIPLPKSSNPDHTKENFNIFDFELTDEEMKGFESIPQKRYNDVRANLVPGSKWIEMINSWKAKND